MLTDKEKEVIRAVCRNDLNAAAAARELYYSRTTIVHFIEKIEDKTGFDCRTFLGAIQLLKMVTEDNSK